MFRAADGDALASLGAYRIPEQVRAAPFRIRASFVGRVVREAPVADPLVGDDGFHLIVSDVRNVKAVNVLSAATERPRR